MKELVKPTLWLVDGLAWGICLWHSIHVRKKRLYVIYTVAREFEQQLQGRVALWSLCVSIWVLPTSIWVFMPHFFESSNNFSPFCQVVCGYLTSIISSDFSSLAGIFLFGSTLYWCFKVVLCRSMNSSNLRWRWNRNGKWNALKLVLEFQGDNQNNHSKIIELRETYTCCFGYSS